ncbi:unnamed protein product, partial [Heterotrigona itama]
MSRMVNFMVKREKNGLEIAECEEFLDTYSKEIGAFTFNVIMTGNLHFHRTLRNDSKIHSGLVVPVLQPSLVRRSSRELGSVHAIVYTHIHAKRTAVSPLYRSMLYSLYTRMYVILRMASWAHTGNSDGSTNCLIQHR